MLSTFFQSIFGMSIVTFETELLSEVANFENDIPLGKRP